jgi:hypothetical protein
MSSDPNDTYFSVCGEITAYFRHPRKACPVLLLPEDGDPVNNATCLTGFPPEFMPAGVRE